MGDRQSRATINHINLPSEIDRVAGKYDMKNYRDHLTAADRQTLNETNLHPFCF